MKEHPFIRGPRPERPLQPAYLKTGRSLLRSLAGLALVAGVGIVSFTVGYPSASGSPAASRNAAVEGKPGAAGEELRTASDRTRPDWLAKLSTAPPSPVAQEPASSGLASAALLEKIEAAASVTGSIGEPRKAPRTIPMAQAKVASAKAPAAVPARPTPAAAAPAPKPAAVKPANTAARKPQAQEHAAAPSTTTLAGFFRRPGMSKPQPLPDPAR